MAVMIKGFRANSKSVDKTVQHLTQPSGKIVTHIARFIPKQLEDSLRRQFSGTGTPIQNLVNDVTGPE
jgi:hypothetical protein